MLQFNDKKIYYNLTRKKINLFLSRKRSKSEITKSFYGGPLDLIFLCSCTIEFVTLRRFVKVPTWLYIGSFFGQKSCKIGQKLEYFVIIVLMTVYYSHSSIWWKIRKLAFSVFCMVSGENMSPLDRTGEIASSCCTYINRIYDRNVVYDRFFHFAKTNFLEIYVNVFFLSVIFISESLISIYWTQKTIINWFDGM